MQSFQESTQRCPDFAAGLTTQSTARPNAVPDLDEQGEDQQINEENDLSN